MEVTVKKGLSVLFSGTVSHKWTLTPSGNEYVFYCSETKRYIRYTTQHDTCPDCNANIKR